MNMRSFVIFSVLIAVAAADVSHLSQYRYNAPNSYVPPASGSPFGQNGHYQTQTPIHYASQYDGVLSAPYTASHQQPQHQSPQYQTGGYQLTAAREYTPTSYQQTSFAQPLSTSYRQSVVQPSAYAAQQQSVHELPPIVTKHFYVHAAPEEPEEATVPRYVSLGRNRKTYKVIFIKAPSTSPSTRIIPILPKHEEKTVVYVLSKKPDINQDIQIPEQPVTEPTKPEVFFIKYKTPEEAEKARQNIQATYDDANADIDSAVQQGANIVSSRVSSDDQSDATTAAQYQSTSSVSDAYNTQQTAYTQQAAAAPSYQSGQYDSGTNNAQQAAYTQQAAAAPSYQSGQYNSGAYNAQQATYTQQSTAQLNQPTAQYNTGAYQQQSTAAASGQQSGQYDSGAYHPQPTATSSQQNGQYHATRNSPGAYYPQVHQYSGATALQARPSSNALLQNYATH